VNLCRCSKKCAAARGAASQVTNDDAPNHGKIGRNGGNGNHGAGEQGLTLRGGRSYKGQRRAGARLLCKQGSRVRTSPSPPALEYQGFAGTIENYRYSLDRLAAVIPDTAALDAATVLRCVAVDVTLPSRIAFGHRIDDHRTVARGFLVVTFACLGVLPMNGVHVPLALHACDLPAS
jgi:hypothetical protein